jgi:hypothetical protein
MQLDVTLERGLRELEARVLYMEAEDGKSLESLQRRPATITTHARKRTKKCNLKVPAADRDHKHQVAGSQIRSNFAAAVRELLPFPLNA